LRLNKIKGEIIK